MAPIPKGGTVAVTGSAGFIGGWVVKQLLDKGYRVRACVRDVNDEEKTGFLKSMPGHASGRLTLHAADLDTPGVLMMFFAVATVLLIYPTYPLTMMKTTSNGCVTTSLRV